MPGQEHLLTIIEPTTGGDATLDLARETVERGGTASLLMVITDRVRRDIDAFAQSEDLGRYEAESQALEQLRTHYTVRIGAASRLETHFGGIDDEVVRYITPDTTAIAVPAHLVTDRLVRRLAERTGRPVVVTPSRAAVA